MKTHLICRLAGRHSSTSERRVQRIGWIQVKTWQPGNTGQAGAATLAGQIRSILESVNLPSPEPGDEALTMQSGTTLALGSDARWFMQVVRIPFWYADRA